MRFLHDNKVKGATLTPSSENANYPASNLKDPRLSRHLRFTSDTWQTLLVDSGGLLKDIFQATVNLLEDSDDLTLWTTQDATVVASGLFYDGSEFAKVTNDGATVGFIYQDETDAFTTLTPSGNVICRKGNTTGNKTSLRVYNLTRSTWIFFLTFDFDSYPNSPGTPTDGTLRWYRWIDSQTVELHFTYASLVALSDDVRFELLSSQYSTVDEYTYWMRPQLEDLPYDTPYVDGSRAAVSPNHTFEMPGMFIFKIKVRPWFPYDVSSGKYFFAFFIDATHRCRCYYYQTDDNIRMSWQDGGVERNLLSQQFDDGSSHDDINSKLILFAAINLKQQTGQRFFVIVDGIKQTEDVSWNAAPDLKISTFSTLSMAHQFNANQGNSQFESVQFWAWDGSDLGTLNTEADIDAALKDKPTIFEQVYQPKIKVSYAALAGHNLSADAFIQIQGNDWDSWLGAPFIQTFDWNQSIILKNFTEKEYPFWRFVINDPNNVDGYIKLGLAYLGAHYEVEEFPDNDLLHKAIDTTKTSFSDGGQAYSRVGIQLKTYQISMGVLQEATRQSLLEMYAAIGLHKSFFLLLDESNQDKLPVLYCKLERGLTYRHAGGYLWRDEAMQFREVF